jgi:hypothetical protein
VTINLPAFTSNPPRIHHQKTTFCTPFLPKPQQNWVNQHQKKITAPDRDLNRAGKNLSASRHAELEKAKTLLSEIIAKQRSEPPAKTAKKATKKAAKKSPAKTPRKAASKKSPTK